METISSKQVLKRLNTENPWWIKPHEIPESYDSLSARPYLDLLYPLITNRSVNRAIVLMGPRRVGKTVIIHHTIDRLINDGINPTHICYISILWVQGTIPFLLYPLKLGKKI